MPIGKEQIIALIKEQFPEATLKLDDLMGDENHYALTIASPELIGKSKIEQHRLINKALSSCLGTSLHALTIKIQEDI